MLAEVKTDVKYAICEKVQYSFPGYHLGQVILRTTKYTKENYIL